MFATVLGMAAFGALKAAVLPPEQAPAGVGGVFRDLVMAPVLEETTFRAGILSTWKSAPKGATAVPFALAHVSQRVLDRGAGFTAWRLLETGASGYVYEQAFRRSGLPAAILAHAAHNAAVMIVSAIRRS